MEETMKIKTVSCEEPGFPDKLKNYSGMPKILYYLGRLPDPSLPSAAVVGARMCSPYGRCQAFRYAKTLGEHQIQVISGLARGIDSEGHKGALETGTPTFAVLGCGIDVCYPASNKWLYRKILEKGGGIISEYPPGTPPKAWAFPARNRLISALSDAVLIVEAKEKSGSLITASFALEQGKSVYAIPGAVTDELSKGCNKLIFDGAGIAYCPEILLLEWGISGQKEEKSCEKEKLGLAQDLDLVYSCLDLRPKNLDDLVEKTGYSSAKVSDSLVRLELMGLARECGRQHYVRQI